MKVNRFEELEVWKLARDLSILIKEITSGDLFKHDVRFRDQIRAASGSVMDNIAEGYERGGNKEFIQFLYISKGSCGEVRSQSYRALDYEYISIEKQKQINDLAITLNVKLNNLIQYLKQSNLKGSKYH